MFMSIPWNICLTGLGGRWQIACVNMFWKKIKLLLLGQVFLSLNADEVTIVNNQSWLLVHVYVMHAWKVMLLKVEMQIILLLWLFNPSCSKGVDSRRDSQKANLFWCLWGLPFPRPSHWSDILIKGEICSLHDWTTLHGQYDKLYCSSFVKSTHDGQVGRFA
jgi:hypothetical protein